MISDNTKQSAAILSIGGLKLIFPQSDIISVDVVADAISTENSNPLIAAVLNKPEGELPVYAFSGELQLQSSLTDESRFCVCIKRHDVYYSLACDGVEVIQLDSNIMQELMPFIMKTDNSPVLKLMLYKQDVVLVVDALSVNKYLQSVENNDV